MIADRVVFVLLGLAALTACAPAATPPPPAATVAPAVSGPLPLPARAEVSPVRLTIPAIGFDQTGLIPLALGAAGELQAPERFSDVGWYEDGPVPGDPGPAVLAAHVDSRTGPAPFFRLRELHSGDEVRVSRSDGGDVVFRVDSVQHYPKNEFPTQAVYGPAPGSALRLITCGGSFDAAKRSYRDNVVVYASQRWD
ncbi:class F sortase [Amycolatopsis sp. BJA-103]|uniref:class F sortase n=1 Tax=Amycolatopsis sp. BJA-103 TaxID=1911175 RepID=UPI000C78E55F|nr:class F sortase [Amycolatopsis sp. BJA-103]AUI58660.1 class F sortase [Amycolatopsis sp. BJA-103]PNE16837.1 class F sortase [Amycolatopsis sp. BJA-103]